jgi:hypothetical protein
MRGRRTERHDVWLLPEFANASPSSPCAGPKATNTINTEIDTPCELHGSDHHLQKLNQKVGKRL